MSSFEQHGETAPFEKRLESCTEIFQNARALFFDVSDTLYTNAELEKEYPRVLTEAVARFKGISTEEASQLIQETTHRLKETEKHVTKVRAVREIGLTREQAQTAIATIQPEKFLQPDAHLLSTLSLLSQKYTLGIISNLRRAHLLDVLHALGIEEHQFSILVTEDIVELTKPHPEPFLKAVELSDFAAEQTIFIGDSPSKDMRPAKEQGMLTILACKHPSAGDVEYADAYITDIAELSTLTDSPE